MVKCAFLLINSEWAHLNFLFKNGEMCLQINTVLAKSLLTLFWEVNFFFPLLSNREGSLVVLSTFHIRSIGFHLRQRFSSRGLNMSFHKFYRSSGSVLEVGPLKELDALGLLPSGSLIRIGIYTIFQV